MNIEFMVTFNQPIVALENLEEQKERVKLIIDPPLKGSYKWKGTQTLAFRPYSLPDATRIKVTVPGSIYQYHIH